MAFKSDLDALILGVLQESPAHGYEIARRVKKLSADALELGENRLYPCLKSLEDAGLVDAQWNNQEGRPPRKVFQLTAAGHQVLDSKRSSWLKFSDAVNSILVPNPRLGVHDGKVS
jgi:DNA-binding PadR family transcriptional regulator